ncbi:MAG: peroxiredoxin [Rhizobiales bacterium]|nr:peroxiredoxin [Hyphomicrobiales bacterium]
MSKKMRKKSSKPNTGKVTREKPQGPKKLSRKTNRAASSSAGKSSKTRVSAPRPESSRRDAQKPLKTAPSKTAPSHNAGPAEGARAPAFDLPRDGGTRVSLNDFAGQKLVIFFYPRADTPGCTREAIDFTRLTSAFAACGTAVLGVSADPVKAQESFRTKHKLSVPLMSDEAHGMLEAYGAWGEKSMYGRTFLGILRTTVLVDRNGRIAKVWRKVKVDGHADEVLAAAQSL